MATFKSAILQNISTSISAGSSFSVTDVPSISISVSGTSTSFTLVFEVSNDGITWGKVACTKMIDGFTQANNTSTIGELWGLELPSGIIKFRANLTSIVNGNITVVVSTVTR